MIIQELIDKLLEVPEEKRNTEVILKAQDTEATYVLNGLEYIGFNINEKIFILEGRK